MILYFLILHFFFFFFHQLKSSVFSNAKLSYFDRFVTLLNSRAPDFSIFEKLFMFNCNLLQHRERKFAKRSTWPRSEARGLCFRNPRFILLLLFFFFFSKMFIHCVASRNVKILFFFAKVLQAQASLKT